MSAPAPVVTGFQAQMAVDDAGTGAAPGGISTKFAGLVTFNLPSLEANKFESTELDQKKADGTTPDGYERELPTGTIKIGQVKGSLHYTKANYLRLQKLIAARGYTFILTSPDDLSASPTATLLTTTFTGFVSKIDDLKFEKGNPVEIPFEFTVQSQPAYT
jgi:hypothetical protein